ncbi:MAG: carbon starvation protein A, partial [Paramuribaculum sp.]|nr:carbon starvation protein A [Paramuribaculum sp.]
NLAAYMAQQGNSAGALVTEISVTWLGTIGGILALLGVIAAPVSTGDTALRSARLIVADILNIKQKTFIKRLLVCIPLFIASFVLMFIDFNVLWRYFAWSNQTLAVFTLWAVTVYMARHNKAYIVSLLPALFMTAVSVSYLLFARRPEGFGLSISIAVAAGIVVATVFLALFLRWKNRLTRTPGPVA